MNDRESAQRSYDKSGNKIPRASMLWERATSAKTWSEIANFVIIGAVGLAAVSLIFGVGFGRTASNNGITGTASKVGKSLNPFVSQETNGIGQLIEGEQNKPTYVAPQNGEKTVEVTKK